MQATVDVCLYDHLGLTEYEAIEAFVRHDPDKHLPFYNGSMPRDFRV